MADWTMWYKYVVKNVARKHGKTATFMPKPIFQDNGSGMHCHQSIWKDEKNLFAGDKYAGLSDMALNYIGGILKHAPAHLRLHQPGHEQLQALVPGYEAPVNLAYSSRNRSASIRIPIGSAVAEVEAARVPLPRPDGEPVPRVLGHADGRPRRHPEQARPGQAARQGHLRAAPEELKDVPKAPGSLDESLKALERDHAFLLKGDVFTSDVIQTWIDYKRENEVDALRLRPHPYEFALYFDN
jgi:glutamine synthetase